MKSKYKLAKQLLTLLEEFENEKVDNAELAHFILWLKKKKLPKPTYDITGKRLEDEIAALFGRLNKFSKSYVKLGLTNLPFVSAADFGFAATVLYRKTISKTSLIKEMVYEKSSGMEIIKRLIKDGILEQFDNPKDKRSTLLKVSAYGKEVITKGFTQMARVSDIVSANLTYEKKLQLITILKELDEFHVNIYNESYSNLEEIFSTLKQS